MEYRFLAPVLMIPFLRYSMSLKKLQSQKRHCNLLDHRSVILIIIYQRVLASASGFVVEWNFVA